TSSFTAPLTLAAGAGAYVTAVSPPGPERWGDYYGAAADPADPAGVWVTGEYHAAPTQDGNWSTSVSRITYVGSAANPPDAPFDVTATAGAASAAIQWAVPADGGSPIISYTVTAAPGGQSVTVPSGAHSATVGGLANG